MWVVMSLFFIFIIVLFSAYNADYVRISYIVGTGRVRLALVIVLAALGGALIAALANLSRQVQLRREIGELKSRLEREETKVGSEAKSE